MANTRCLYCDEPGVEHEDRDDCIAMLKSKIRERDDIIKVTAEESANVIESQASKLPSWRNPSNDPPAAEQTVLGWFREDWSRAIPGGTMLLLYKGNGVWADEYDDNDSPAPEFWMPLPEPPK